MKFKIFNKYDVSEIKIKDPALKTAINLEPKIVVKTQGREASKKEYQRKVNIIERLINRIGVAAHRGKKHKVEKGDATGKYSKNTKTVLKAFDIIEKNTGKNPIQILIKAIENCAPRDEVTVIEYGGARYPQPVDVSPLRRVNLAIRWICQGGSDKAFSKNKKLFKALAEEIIMASEENMESFAMKKKNESEKQADSAR